MTWNFSKYSEAIVKDFTEDQKYNKYVFNQTIGIFILCEGILPLETNLIIKERQDNFILTELINLPFPIYHHKSYELLIDLKNQVAGLFVGWQEESLQIKINMFAQANKACFGYYQINGKNLKLG